MFAAMPFLAELGSIEKFVIMALAVAGGFLIGFLLTNIVLRMLFKFWWKKTPPEKLLRVTRFAGGVAAAILVYLLLTGDGGLGLGGGGGGGSKDPNEGKNNLQNPPKQEEPKDKVDPKQKPKDKVIDSKSGVLTVFLLRFDPEKRFYRIGNDPKPLTLEEVLQHVDALVMNDKKSVVQVDIEVGDPDYPVQAVSVLEVELNNRGIKSTRPIVKKPKSN